MVGKLVGSEAWMPELKKKIRASEKPLTLKGHERGKKWPFCFPRGVFL